GGRVVALVHAERSGRYWGAFVWERGVKHGELATRSMADIMSRRLDHAADDGQRFVGVYTRARLRRLFCGFERVRISQRQLDPVFQRRRWLAPILERVAGSSLIVKAAKARIDQ